jgi:hypothetical protein
LEALYILFFPLLIIGVPVFLITTRVRRNRRMKAKNYRWYRMQYPQAIRGDRVACHSCGSTHIQVRNVMQRSFMREHFCGQCGESLYYSPEGKA